MKPEEQNCIALVNLFTLSCQVLVRPMCNSLLCINCYGGGCREGDLVTITDRNDLQVAFKEVMDHSDRLQMQHGGPKLPNMIPPLRIHATRAKSEVGVVCLPCIVRMCACVCQQPWQYSMGAACFVCASSWSLSGNRRMLLRPTDSRYVWQKAGSSRARSRAWLLAGCEPKLATWQAVC